MKALICVALFFVFPIFSSAQSTPPKDTIPVIDMREYDPDKALVAAIKNSRNDVVVVLVRGASEELLTKAKAQMNALAHQGYTRIGIVRCDFEEGEVEPVIGVLANGTIYAAIRDAKPTTKHMVQCHNLVRDAYKEFILPKVSSGANGGR